MPPIHNFEWRAQREYNNLFVDRADNDLVGPAWKIEVFGLPSGGSVPSKQVDQSDLSKLIDPSTGGFWEMMCFNDWLFDLEKIEILCSSRIVRIFIAEKSLF
ncbi:MAG: hypothetical protein WC982_00105 [Advenella sp.]